MKKNIKLIVLVGLLVTMICALSGCYTQDCAKFIYTAPFKWQWDYGLCTIITVWFELFFTFIFWFIGFFIVTIVAVIEAIFSVGLMLLNCIFGIIEQLLVN